MHASPYSCVSLFPLFQGCARAGDLSMHTLDHAHEWGGYMCALQCLYAPAHGCDMYLLQLPVCVFGHSAAWGPVCPGEFMCVRMPVCAEPSSGSMCPCLGGQCTLGGTGQESGALKIQFGGVVSSNKYFLCPTVCRGMERALRRRSPGGGGGV